MRSDQETVRCWWERFEPTDAPQKADLAFFRRPGIDWQVMLVGETDPMSVIGACPIIGFVAERTLAEYLALGWELRGFRVMPLPVES